MEKERAYVSKLVSITSSNNDWYGRGWKEQRDEKQ
jgi:hypothetical protein